MSLGHERREPRAEEERKTERSATAQTTPKIAVSMRRPFGDGCLVSTSLHLLISEQLVSHRQTSKRVRFDLFHALVLSGKIAVYIRSVTFSQVCGQVYYSMEGLV